MTRARTRTLSLSLARLAALALAAAPAAARAEPASADAPPRPARVSRLAGELFLRGPFDEAEAPSTLNALVLEGDVLRCGEGCYAELELGHGSFARLAPGAVLAVERLEGQPHLSLKRGAAYLSVGAAAPEGSLTAPRGGLGLAPGAVARLDRLGAGEDGFVARVVGGAVAVECLAARLDLGRGEEVRCTARGAARGAFDPAKGDAFDAWSLAREEAIGRAGLPEGVSADDQGIHDLEGYGAWVAVDARWYWRPEVGDDWRPYWDGYWAWTGPWGWSWTAYAPWGYVTHHHGHWVWLKGHGWVWAPGRGFAGAWVVWAAFDGYLGWAPCDPWGRPIAPRTRHSHYDPWAWSFARPGYFWEGGGDWRDQGHRGRPERGAREEATAPSDAPGTPFLTATPEDLRVLRPRPLRDASALIPRKLSEGTPAVTLPPKRGAGAAALARAEGTARSSLLPELVAEEAARKPSLHGTPAAAGASGAREDDGAHPLPERTRAPRWPSRAEEPVGGGRTRPEVGAGAASGRPAEAAEADDPTPAERRPSFAPPARPTYAPPKDERPTYAPPKDERPSYAPPVRRTYVPPKDERPSYAPPKDARPSYAPAQERRSSPSLQPSARASGGSEAQRGGATAGGRASFTFPAQPQPQPQPQPAKPSGGAKPSTSPKKK